MANLQEPFCAVLSRLRYTFMATPALAARSIISPPGENSLLGRSLPPLLTPVPGFLNAAIESARESATPLRCPPEKPGQVYLHNHRSVPIAGRAVDSADALALVENMEIVPATLVR